LFLSVGAIICSRLPSFYVDEPPLPNPNGFEDLVRAGQSIVGQIPGPNGDYRSAGEDELRQWVEANHEALTIARHGLDRECRVVLPASQAQLQEHMNQVSSLRQLCRLMDASALLAETDGQLPQAVRNGLDVIRVANQGTRGGLLIDALTGMACEWVGQRALARLRDQLTALECRKLVTALEAIDAQREPDDSIIQRDRTWYSAQHNVLSRAILAVHPAANQLLKSSTAPFELASKRAKAGLRLLVAELAVRRYRLENGFDPPVLKSLVPQYFARVPTDPYLGRPIIYRPDQGQGHRLYCVGPDGQDDGGKPLTDRSDWTKVRGDVRADPAEAVHPASKPGTPKTPSAEMP